MTKLTKPVRRTAHLNVAHGIKPDIVVTLYPGGILGLRESGRRQEYRVALAALMERAVIDDAEQARRTRKQRR